MNIYDMKQDENEENLKPNGRVPKCTRCRNHGNISELRGHKHKCYWRDCDCAKCLISSDKQRATADRIALFRQQIREVQEEDRVTKNKEFERCCSPPKYNSLKKEVEVTQSKKRNSLQSSTVLPNLNQVDVRTKNLEILKYIFPFYDVNVLDILFRGCHDDVLQTVLSISSAVLENQKRYPTVGYHLKRHMTQCTPNTVIEQCCSSPYCPVNSYVALRRRDSVQEHLAYSAGAKRHSYSDDSVGHSSPKRRYSSEVLFTAPFCHSCRKYGYSGDKFCPFCGVLY